MESEDRVKNSDLALEWWYEVAKERITKDEFLANRNEWEHLRDKIHNTTDVILSHDDTKNLIRALDKLGLLGHETLDVAIERHTERKNNIKEFGTPEGREGFTQRAERMSVAVRRDLSKRYREYIAGSAWKARSRRYLDQCCTRGGMWICEMCGDSHPIKDKGRTIQVHHNNYIHLDGCERDTDLMAACEGLCHDLADIARKIKTGKIDKASINDALRPLFGEEYSECPHGEEPSECNACMVESDIAYDSAREDRIFGR